MSLFEIRRPLLNDFMRMREVSVSPTPVSGEVNNLDVSSAPFVRLTGLSSDASLTGIVAPTDSVKSGMLWLRNETNFKLFISAESGSSTAANRFQNNWTLGPGDMVAMLYSASLARWIVSGTKWTALDNTWTGNNTFTGTLLAIGSATFEGGARIGNGSTFSVSATDGFLWLPYVNGAPTGTPIFANARMAVVMDISHNVGWFHNGSEWRTWHQRNLHTSAGATQTLSLAYGAGTFTVGANTTFATDERASGRSYWARITASGGPWNLTWPSWKWVGSTPSSIGANKTGLLELWCFGTADTDIVARWTVEP